MMGFRKGPLFPIMASSHPKEVVRSIIVPGSIDERLKQHCIEYGRPVELLIRDALRHYVNSGAMMREHYVRMAAQEGLSINFRYEGGKHYAIVSGREPGQPIPEGERDIATFFAVRTFPEALYVSEDETGITFEISELHRQWTGAS